MCAPQDTSACFYLGAQKVQLHCGMGEFTFRNLKGRCGLHVKPGSVWDRWWSHNACVLLVTIQVMLCGALDCLSEGAVTSSVLFYPSISLPKAIPKLLNKCTSLNEDDISRPSKLLLRIHN